MDDSPTSSVLVPYGQFSSVAPFLPLRHRYRLPMASWEYRRRHWAVVVVVGRLHSSRPLVVRVLSLSSLVAWSFLDRLSQLSFTSVCSVLSRSVWTLYSIRCPTKRRRWRLFSWSFTLGETQKVDFGFCVACEQLSFCSRPILQPRAHCALRKYTLRTRRKFMKIHCAL